jgi:ribonuclease P protein component
MPERKPYPTEARLRRDKDFRAVVAGGEVLPGRQCLVRRLVRETGGARLGVAAPRGMGGAVVRNRFRRLVREAFREIRAALGSVDLLVSPRRGLTEPTLGGITADLRRAAQPRAAPGARGSP